jgi:hypothetical protein
MLNRSAFISYRREDTAGYAGRLFDRLNARFPQRVFMDVVGLDPGVDFVDEIQKAVGKCGALIVLIGKHWAVTSEGTNRLLDPHDFVRLEVAHALERKIRVIPVLVGDARMPAPETLPPELGSLLRRQALKLEDNAFDYHVSELVEALEKELGPGRPSAAGAGGTATAAQPAREERPAPVYAPVVAPTRKPRRLLWLGVGAGLVVVFLGLAVIGYMMEEFSNTTADPQATQAVVNALQNAASTPAAQPNAAPPPAQPAPAVESTPGFEPIGRWRISSGEGAPVSLLVNFESNGVFSAQTEGAGFRFPASAGSWNYNRSLHLLTVTGINNLGAPFQTLFQNIRYQDGYFHAFVPGSGEVALARE